MILSIRVVVALFAFSIVAQAQFQSGDADRDYTINGNGSFSGLTFTPIVPNGFMANAYSCQDAGAPVLMSTSTATSAVPWYSSSTNLFNIGPVPLSMVFSGLGGGFFDQFFWTNALGQWGVTVPLQGLAQTTFFNMGHIASSSPEGFWVSQVQALTPGLPVAGGSLNPSGNGSVYIDLVPHQTELRFYGQSYGGVWVNADGFLSFGGSLSDFTTTSGEFLQQRPRIASFWTDLDPPQGGTMSWTLDPNLSPPLLQIQASAIPESFGAPGVHSFNVEIDATPTGAFGVGGEIRISHPSSNLSSNYDTLVGITPGFNASSALPRDLSADLLGGGHTGSVDEALYEFYAGSTSTTGLPGPLFDLSGFTLRFTPFSPLIPAYILQ